MFGFKSSLSFLAEKDDVRHEGEMGDICFLKLRKQLFEIVW